MSVHRLEVHEYAVVHRLVGLRLPCMQLIYSAAEVMLIGEVEIHVCFADIIHEVLVVHQAIGRHALGYILSQRQAVAVGKADTNRTADDNRSDVGSATP